MSSFAEEFNRPPSIRGSTKLPIPVRVIRPGRRAPDSRSNVPITPPGMAYASISFSTANFCIRGDQDQCPPMTLFTNPL